MVVDDGVTNCVISTLKLEYCITTDKGTSFTFTLIGNLKKMLIINNK